MIKPRAYKGVNEKESLWVTFHVPENVLGKWGNEPTHSQMSSHFGNWNLDELLIFQRDILGVKIHWIEKTFIPLESSWNIAI